MGRPGHLLGKSPGAFVFLHGIMPISDRFQQLLAMKVPQGSSIRP
jgi:hypothetical protein